MSPDRSSPPSSAQRLTVLESVLLHNLLGLVQDVAHIYTNDQLGTSLCAEHGQDSSSTTDIEDDLVLEQVRVLEDGISVGEGSDGVFEHFLVDT